MTFLVWLALSLPIGFIAGAILMGLWLALKPLAIGGVRAALHWLRITVTGGL